MTTQPDDDPNAWGRFFLPGPTEVHPDILAAQCRPLIGHRGDQIRALIRELQPGLQEIFGTTRPVLISTSSGTGLMEAAIRNGVRRRVLCLVNGAFSGRFAVIAEACGLQVERYEVPWGEAHDPDRLAEVLRESDADAVTAVHSETSTGVLNPLPDLAAVVNEAGGRVFLVDSVTGAGGAELHADAWGLDFVLTGSHKALALPPGLAFGVASERMMERAQTATGTGFYFDLVRMQKKLDVYETPTTPAVSILYATATQMKRIADEGLSVRLERHRRMAARTAQWVEETRTPSLPLYVLAPEGVRSPTVTCIELPEGIAGPDVASAMRQRGFVIGAGYGKLKPTTIRLGHMGDHSMDELEAVLAELGDVLGGMTA
jgi:aspartate aminotransferase-like enzyme